MSHIDRLTVTRTVLDRRALAVLDADAREEFAQRTLTEARAVIWTSVVVRHEQGRCETVVTVTGRAYRKA